MRKKKKICFSTTFYIVLPASTTKFANQTITRNFVLDRRGGGNKKKLNENPECHVQLIYSTQLLDFYFARYQFNHHLNHCQDIHIHIAKSFLNKTQKAIATKNKGKLEKEKFTSDHQWC